MRKHLWQVDRVIVDLEDRDATVSLVHHISLGEIRAGFWRGPGRRAEIVAAEIVLD